MCAFAEACVLPIILVVVPLMACDLSLSTNQASTLYATLTLGTINIVYKFHREIGWSIFALKCIFCLNILKLQLLFFAFNVV